MASDIPPAATVSLKVADAYTSDVGRNVARIDRKTMKRLGVSDGFIIEVKGKDRSTVALWAPLKPPDEGKSVIRLDGLTRNNATVTIGYTVVVRRMRALKAEKIVVMSLEPIPII